jgi:hypothetical protein
MHTIGENGTGRKNIPLDPPSKGELCVTMVVGICGATCFEPELMWVPIATQSVASYSPFDGGSRGMFFYPGSHLLMDCLS